MKNLLIIISLTFLMAYSLFSIEMSRSELLDEGRRTIKVMADYSRISGLNIRNFAELKINSFMPYSVDSNQGPDKVNVVISSLNTKLRLNQSLDLYVIANYYAILSSSKQSVKSDSGNLLLTEDGKAQLESISYGKLLDLYLGVDYKLSFIKLQMGAIISYENLLNTVYENRNFTAQETSTGRELGQYINGIQYDKNGNPLYREITEREKYGFAPIFGLSLFNIKILDLRGLVALSNTFDSVTSHEIISDIKFYNLTREAGVLSVGYIYYPYWNNDVAFIAKYQTMIDTYQFSAGLEYLFKWGKLSVIFVELIISFGKRGINSVISNNNYNSNQSENNNDNSDSDNYRNRNESEQTINYFNNYSLSHYYFLVRLNLARTPETEIIKQNSDFLFGIKLGLGWRAMKFLKLEFYLMYNIYDDLKVFRRATNKFGIGLNLLIAL